MPEAGLRATAMWLVSGRRESPHTRTAYVRDVSWWVAWCAAHECPPAAATTCMADLYMAALTAAGLARATAGRRVAAVSSWYTYLVRERSAAINPFEGTERPRLDAGDSGTRGLSREQVTAVLAHAAGVPYGISPHSFRHSAITIALSEGQPLHVVQDFAGHADPRTTRRYARARESLDRSPAYRLAASMAPETAGQPTAGVRLLFFPRWCRPGPSAFVAKVRDRHGPVAAHRRSAR